MNIKNDGYNKRIMIKFSLQEEAYATGKELNHQFYCAKDTKKGGKLVSSFKNLDQFLHYFDTQTDKHLYEKVINERVEYYDIDGKIDENPYWKNNKKTILDDFFKHRQGWISTTNYNNKGVDMEKDVFILESKNLDIKKSFHIIIRNGFIFRNNIQQKEFINDFKKYLDNLNTGLTIDNAPYGANQCFRTIGSSKIGSDRTLIRSDYNQLSLKCDRKKFFVSCIEPELDIASKESCISNDSILGIEENKHYLNYISGFKIKEKTEIKFEQKCSNDDIFKLFNHLSNHRWDNRQSCLSLIWIGKKFGLCDKDIHEFTQLSAKYNADWVQSIINSARDDCPYTMGTLYYYLSEDVDSDTLKKIFPKNKTFDEIISIPEKKRTEEQQQFLDRKTKLNNTKKINKILDYNIDSKDLEIIDENTKYCKEIVFPSGYRSIAIHLKMGGGKTFQIINFLSKLGKDDRIVFLSPRITFANSITAEINKGLQELNGDNFIPFVCYTDISNKRILRRSNRIVISMESIHHLTDQYDPDYIIIDECQANLTSHLSNTNGSNLDNNIYCFETFLKNKDSKIIWADAFLGPKTIDYISDLGIKTKVYKYQTKMDERTVYYLPDIDPEIDKAIRKNKDVEIREKLRIKASSWYKKLCQKLDTGKRVYFPCTTRSKVLITKNLIYERYGDSKKCLFYVGKSKGEKAYDFSNVNKEWTKCDLVMTTTTITVGINYDIQNYFHCIIMYLSSSANNTVVDIMQCHKRVRYIIDNEIFVFRSEKRFKVLDKSEISILLANKEKWFRDHYKGFNESSEKHIKNLAINIFYEHSLSRGLLKECTETFLKLCNYTIKDDTDEDVEIEEIEPDEEEEIDDVGDDFIDEYLKLKEITTSEMRDLENQRYYRKLSDNEEKMIKKYFFVRFFDSNIDPNRLTTSRAIQGIFWYFINNKYKAMNVLATCKLEKLLNNGEVTFDSKAEDCFDNHGVGLLHSDKLMLMEMTKDIINELGFKHINDTQSLIDTDTIEGLFEKYKENYKLYSETLNIRDQRKNKNEVNFKNVLGLISNVISQSPHSLCKFKPRNKRRVRVNGKQIWKNTYGLEFDDKIIKNLMEKHPEIRMELNMIPMHLYDLLGNKKEIPLKRLMK